MPLNGRHFLSFLLFFLSSSPGIVSYSLCNAGREEENQAAAENRDGGDFLRQEESIDIAIDFVSSQLSRHASIRGLNRLIYWHLESAHGKVRDKLQMLYDITRKLLENKPIYRCGHCGFSGKLLHWHCPSCKTWGSIKPIHGLEGD